jgi:hypothetical protein
LPANSAPGILFLITADKPTKRNSVCTSGVHHASCLNKKCSFSMFSKSIPCPTRHRSRFSNRS